jgi:2'-5' RNA ligase
MSPVDHVVIPLDAAHRAAVEQLVGAACVAASVASTPASCRHVTLASFERLTPTEAQAVVEAVAARTAPFLIHAHGYGLFAGEHSTDLNLHVPVIRSPALESLRADLQGALASAGAHMAHWVEAAEWSPHITLIDGRVTTDDLGRVVGQLLRRHHPSWRIPVGLLALATPRGTEQRWVSVPLNERRPGTSRGGGTGW